jgi:hypothetical protein
VIYERSVSLVIWYSEEEHSLYPLAFCDLHKKRKNQSNIFILHFPHFRNKVKCPVEGTSVYAVDHDGRARKKYFEGTVDSRLSLSLSILQTMLSFVVVLFVMIA